MYNLQGVQSHRHSHPRIFWSQLNRHSSSASPSIRLPYSPSHRKPAGQALLWVSATEWINHWRSEWMNYIHVPQMKSQCSLGGLCKCHWGSWGRLTWGCPWCRCSLVLINATNTLFGHQESNLIKFMVKQLFWFIATNDLKECALHVIISHWA